MKDTKQKIVDEAFIDCEYLWNNSGLNDDIVEDAIEALKDIRDESRVPEGLSLMDTKAYTLMLRKKTCEMILKIYNLKSFFDDM